MSQLTAPVPTATTVASPSPAAWRWAGGLGLAAVVVMLGAFAVEDVAVEHGAKPASVLHAYGDVAVGRVFGAGYVEAMSFVLLVPALVLFSRLLGRRTETGRVAARSFLALGVAYVASTLAIGFAPMFAATYAAHHGVDASVIATVNDLRNYAFVLQVALSVAMALALGVAALADRAYPRFVGWGGVALGTIGLAATPFAHNGVSLVQTIWWVGLSILCLRGGPKNS